MGYGPIGSVLHYFCNQGAAADATMAIAAHHNSIPAAKAKVLS